MKLSMANATLLKKKNAADKFRFSVSAQPSLTDLSVSGVIALIVISALFSFSSPAVTDQIDDTTVKQWSGEFRNWFYYPEHVLAPEPEIKGFPDIKMTDVPTVFQVEGDDAWYMTFIGYDGVGYQSFLAVSDDLVHWKHKGLAMGYGDEGDFDHGGVVLGAYLYTSYDIDAPRVLKKRSGLYWSLYGAYPRQGGYELRPGYEGLAGSVDGFIWVRGHEDPILSVHQKDCEEWEQSCIYQPWLVEFGGLYYNFYNAANGAIEQTGAAFSEDLKSWERHKNNPVLPIGEAGSYNETFSSDPKVFRDGDHWVMFFFGVGKDGAHIMAAYSYDLLEWTIDKEPLYKSGGHPDGLDSKYAHKISLVKNPRNGIFYMFYCAVGDKGRGIGLLTSGKIEEVKE